MVMLRIGKIEVPRGRPSSQKISLLGCAEGVTGHKGLPPPDPGRPYSTAGCAASMDQSLAALEWLLALQPETHLICSGWTQP